MFKNNFVFVFVGEINELRRLVIATQAGSQIHQTQLTAKLFTRDPQNSIKLLLIFICFENKLVNCYYDVINHLNPIAFEFNLKAKIRKFINLLKKQL